MPKIYPNHRRSQTVGFRLDPKLDYLLTLAARDEGCSVSSYLEQALRNRLAEQDKEPAIGHDIPTLPAPKPLWEEKLWSEDESDRFFLLAVYRHDLLTPAEARLWKLLSGSILYRNEKLSPETFRAAYNDTAIDKAHLDVEENHAGI